MFCKYCGKEIHEKAVICPNCGCATGEPFQTKQPFGVGAMIGLILLTIFIPLVGIIVGAVNLKYEERKGQAMALLITGIILMIIYIISYATKPGLYY